MTRTTLAATTRLALWSDRGDILDLVVNMGSHEDVGRGADPMRRLGALLQNSETRVIVAERDGRIVGFAELQARTSTTGDVREAWLGALAVHADHRSTGVGGALLRAIDAAACELGCVRIALESSAWRTEAHGFYRSHGFAQRSPAERFERAAVPIAGDDCIQRFLSLAARAAGAVQCAIAGLAERGAVGIGADGAPTEAADRAAEDAALETLAPLGVTIVSEERGIVGATIATGDYWIAIDPLDGSRNFRAGYPPYATAMGLVRDGLAVAGYVCELGSMRRWWSDGARAFADGGRIAARAGRLVAQPSPTPGQTLATPDIPGYRLRISGSTATDLCRVADGSLAAFVALDRRVTHVHDLAGPLAILHAAGATVLDGTTGAPPALRPDPMLTYAIVAAADARFATRSVRRG